MKLLSLYPYLMMITFCVRVLSIPLITPYDDYGCCVSCGYTYCHTLLECVRPWETECPKLINPFDNNFILDNNNEVSGH